MHRQNGKSDPGESRTGLANPFFTRNFANTPYNKRLFENLNILLLVDLQPPYTNCVTMD